MKYNIYTAQNFMYVDPSCKSSLSHVSLFHSMIDMIALCWEI